MAPRKRVPDEERCEECTFDRWFHARCDKRGKFTVLAWRNQQFDGEPREVRLCGTHKLMAERGRSLSVFSGNEDGYMNRVKAITYHPKKTEANRLKDELESAERDQRWKKSAVNEAKSRAGRAMFEQAPEILEMLFMVAERGDQRAMAAIQAIQEGMDSVEKADEVYQNLLTRIEELQARLEKAKEAQADGP